MLCMDRLKQIHDVLVHSSIFMGVVAASMVAAASVLSSVSPAVPAVIGFLSAFSVYTINKVTDIAEDAVSYPSRVSFVQRHKTLLLVAAVASYAVAIGISFQYGLMAVGLTVFPAVLGALYSIEWIPVSPVSRLKDVFLANTATVALTWAVPVAYLPVVIVGGNIGVTAHVVAVFFFIRVFITTEAFNIRDIEGDAAEGIRTLPVVLGVNGTQAVLHALNVLSFLILLIAVQAGILPLAMWIAVSPVVLYAAGYIFALSRTEKLDVLTTVVDAEYILMALLLASAVIWF